MPRDDAYTRAGPKKGIQYGGRARNVHTPYDDGKHTDLYSSHSNGTWLYPLFVENVRKFVVLPDPPKPQPTTNPSKHQPAATAIKRKRDSISSSPERDHSAKPKKQKIGHNFQLPGGNSISLPKRPKRKFEEIDEAAESYEEVSKLPSYKKRKHLGEGAGPLRYSTRRVYADVDEVRPPK